MVHSLLAWWLVMPRSAEPFHLTGPEATEDNFVGKLDAGLLSRLCNSYSQRRRQWDAMAAESIKE